MSSTCFEPEGSSLGRRTCIQVWYSVFYMHQYKESYRYTRVGTLRVATIYLQLIQNRYMFRSFTFLQCSHPSIVYNPMPAMWKS